MQTSVEVALTISSPAPPTTQLSWPESLMWSSPALPRMRVCEIVFEKWPDPARIAVTPSELQPAGVSWEICRTFNDVPTWLTGTLVLAVKLVTSVAATISVRSPASARAAVARSTGDATKIRSTSAWEGSLASLGTAYYSDCAASRSREGR